MLHFGPTNLGPIRRSTEPKTSNTASSFRVFARVGDANFHQQIPVRPLVQLLPMCPRRSLIRSRSIWCSRGGKRISAILASLYRYARLDVGIGIGLFTLSGSTAHCSLLVVIRYHSPLVPTTQLAQFICCARARITFGDPVCNFQCDKRDTKCTMTGNDKV